MDKITFNIITPSYFGETQLALLVLKSYIVSKDSGIDIQLNKFYTEDETETICGKILGQNAAVACFSLYVWTEKKVREVCARLKELNNGITIIIGGNVPTYQGKELLERDQFYDIAVFGEGEETLYRLLKDFILSRRELSAINNIAYRSNGRVIVTPRQENYNIEEQYHPLLLDDFKESDVLFFETSRGCPHKCKYCAYNMNFDGDNVLRFYPYEKIEKDLENIFSLPKLKRLDYTDASVVFQIKDIRGRGLKILKLMNSLNERRKSQNLPLIEIGVDINLESLDEEILREIKIMNTFVYGFGLQSIHHSVLKIARRPFNEKLFTHYFNRLAEKSGANLNLELMFGLPGDTFDKFLQSVEYVIGRLNVHFLVCFRFAVLPGSTFWKEKEKYEIECDPDPPYYILSTPTFPAEDLQKAEVFSFFIQLIYTLFRGIKRAIDQNFPENKVKIYLELTNILSTQYRDFFDVDHLLQGDVYDYVIKLRRPEHMNLRQELQLKMRRHMKSLIKKQPNSAQETAPPA